MVTLPSANCVCLGWIDHWSCTSNKGLSHIWYPPTLHMSMYNECLIHLSNCNWLNVLYILNHMLIKHKKIFEYFELFLESVLFWKFSENPFFFFYVTLFWRLTLMSQASRETLVMSLLKSSRDSVVSQYPSREKYLEKFQNFLVFGFFVTQLGDLFMSESSSCELT